MKNSLIQIFLLSSLIACQSITATDDDLTIDNRTQEYQISFSNDLSPSVSQHISGFSSLTHFTPAVEQKILISEGSYSNLVFALNENQLPLLASFLTDEQHYTFGYKETAVALTSVFTLPFIEQDKSTLISLLNNDSAFTSLVERIEYLSQNSRSFVNDELALSLIQQISSTLTDQFIKKPRSTPLEFNRIVTDSNTAEISSNTKVPFNFLFDDLVNNQNSSGLVHSGHPLDSENHGSSFNSTSFDINNGAYKLMIESDRLASHARVSKILKDLVLKLHYIVGLNSDEYEKGDFLEKEVADLDVPNTLSKEEALNFTKNFLSKNKNFLLNQFFTTNVFSRTSEINLSTYTQIIQSLVLSQDEKSPIYSNDIFYYELDAFENHSQSTTLCFEDSKEVACEINAQKIKYSIRESGCFEGEYKIKFGANFFAPFGLDDGSKVKIDWEFGPSGNSGFWLIPIKDHKAVVNGKTRTTGCFNFGSTQELTLSITLKDHELRNSNTTRVKIKRPKAKSYASSQNSSAILAN